MAGLFLLRHDSDAPPPRCLSAVDQQFQRHGFAATSDVALPGWRGLRAPYFESDLPTWHGEGDTLVVVAGTLAVDGRFGAAALAALPGAVTERGPDWSRLAGEFAALVRRDGRIFLFTDFFGAFPLYHDAERQVFSTSLLALVEALPRVAFAPQGVYEYAFNIAPTGNDTVFEGISTLDPGTMVELTPNGTIPHPLAKPLPARARRIDMADRLAQHRAVLADVVGPAAAAFGDAIRTPLSGGIDARLLLAALRREGARPSVYVYGPEQSDDVRLARAIGEAEGFAVDWTDKRAGLPDPDAFAGLVEAEFHALDALPNYGNIFDNGGNARAMAARHASGVLAASGGCGEVYRDFFYLPDRPTSPRAVARSFFARMMPADATTRFDRGAFLARVADKVAAALGAEPDDRLPRALIEQAYPRMRCRALFGREIALEARHGPYLMPFLDHRVVAAALELPMALKQAGRFEARLLAAIDPALARHPSTYGHCFARPPSRSRRLGEWSSRHRPIWLRERSYALRRRLGPVGDDHGGLVGDGWLSRVVNPGFPAMHRFFRVERIADSGLIRRIAALEYLAAHLGTKLAS